MKLLLFTSTCLGFLFICSFGSKTYNSKDLEIWQTFFTEANMKNALTCNDTDTFNDPCSYCNAHHDAERPHVKCTKKHHEYFVSEIVLKHNGLSGTLKSSLSGMKYLELVDLRGNHQLKGLGPEGCIQEIFFCGNIDGCLMGTMKCSSDNENSGTIPTPRPSASQNDGDDSDNDTTDEPTPHQETIPRPSPAFKYSQDRNDDSKEYLERIDYEDEHNGSTKPQWQWNSNSFRLDPSDGGNSTGDANGLSHRIGATMGQTATYSYNSGYNEPSLI